MRKKIAPLLVGIDPGMQGGLALVANAKSEAMKTPKDFQEAIQWIEQFRKGEQPVFIFIEDIRMFREEVGGDANVGKAMQMQKLFARTEQSIGMLVNEGYYVCRVPAISWQTALNLRVRGDSDKQRKNRYKEFAQQKHHDIRVTLWNADAFCLGQFGAMKMHYDQSWVLDRLVMANKRAAKAAMNWK